LTRLRLPFIFLCVYFHEVIVFTSLLSFFLGFYCFLCHVHFTFFILFFVEGCSFRKCAYILSIYALRPLITRRGI